MSVSRVCFVSVHTSPLARPGTGDAGGMNVVELALAEALQARGIRVEIVTRSSAPDDAGLVVLPSGVAVRSLRAGPQRPVAKEDLAAVVPEFAAAMARLERPDVVHSHYWLSGLAGVQAARGWGVPHVQSFHTLGAMKNASLAPGDRGEPVARIEAERRIVRHSRLVVTTTEAERDSVVRDYGASPSRVAVVAPGVDDVLFHPGAVPPSRRAPLLLVVGRVQPLKAQDLAIRAFARLDPALGAELAIVGEPTPGADGYLRELEALAARSGAGGRIRFLGSQSRADVARLMREAAVLLVPSHSESFGLVALEAAASGTPVVARRTQGLVESVRHGVSGILVDGGAPGGEDEAEEWARAIAALLADPERQAELSADARAWSASLSWSGAAQRLGELYLLVSTHPTPTHPTHNDGLSA
ncbi:glycosyltransferase [Compostimonas suwonensis]|uniref:D-inositol 3-phosphate glycosyltransferase n=1 Tax=Compostimonas suwonensis TaxID=1048394 RepID=A0A2M9C463_9MICO|nr:glycosyltransferase [Compostimonas suwonensis]PJJ65313.1 D-inositol-3-phosphate glycosyltransferase [Compostimonas suwonensis]